VLLRGARNARVQPGGPGYLDVSAAIQPRDIPEGPVDRSQGDVHALGNPHYLLDPINGLKVSRLIRDRLASLRPKRRAYFEKRYVDFRGRLGAALIGRELAEKYDVEKLMILHDHGRLDAFLEQEGDVALLGGWLGRLKHLNGAPVVADHNMWNYLAPRFGLQVIGYMEPRPGLTPTTRHLSSLVQTMRDRGVKLVIASPYFPDRHAAFLADHTGAVPVVLAHQVQAVADAADYLAVFETNLQRILREMRREEAP
jgi:ABC-type Zn uptake system ZnuABC Zn-binding protein ZnuA